jgi:L-ascorbate metabolism protein UlaG (beta-lactamase superfamily)
MSDHFDGKRFHNPTPLKRSFLDFLRWVLTREPGRWDMRLTQHAGPPPPRRVGHSELRVTFVNHATVLVQMAGLNLLTDPHWSPRTSPVTWLGPRRYRLPGVRFEDLPPIDAVLVSHNHFDHMDLPTLGRLAAHHDPQVVVPLGNRRTLASAGITRVTELDWWERVTLPNGVVVHAVPAQHWSKRTLFDTNQALWAGFYIESPPGSVYFAGDTAMAGHFEHIRTRLGAPALAMIPIGAYKPRWFMAPAHTSPAEAVEAYVMLEARYLLPIHYGTFPVGDDGQDEPLHDLRRAVRRHGVAPDRVWVLDNGESRTLPAPSTSRLAAGGDTMAATPQGA